MTIHVCHQRLVNDDLRMPPKACKRPRLPPKACERRSTYATKGLYATITVCHQRLVNDSVGHQRLIIHDQRMLPKTCKHDPRLPPKACKRLHLPQMTCERRSTYATKSLYTAIHVSPQDLRTTIHDCHQRLMNDCPCHQACKQRSTYATKSQLVDDDPRMPPKACKRQRLPPKACEGRSTYATKCLETVPPVDIHLRISYYVARFVLAV